MAVLSVPGKFVLQILTSPKRFFNSSITLEEFLAYFVVASISDRESSIRLNLSSLGGRIIRGMKNVKSLVSQDLLSHSYRALVLHGGVDQIDRDSTILDFKAGRVPILVATSVAARGLDVKQLVLVVNFDAPNHYEDYVHR